MTASENEAHIWQTLSEFTLPGKPGYEHLALGHVIEVLQSLNWPKAHLARLKQAVSEALLKAIERSPPEGSAHWLLLRVLIPEDFLARQGTDTAGHEPTPLSLPQGWGFFLIERAVPATSSAPSYLIELFLYLEGEADDLESD